MALTIRSSFTVDAQPDVAWRSLTDIEQSAPCFPGAELKEQQPDGSYKGGFTVKLGPLTFKFNGKFKITEQDDAQHTMVVAASGTDTKGRGGAEATINVAVVEESGKSKVNVVSDVNLSGTVAQYGRGVGMIEALTKQLLEQFGKNLATQIMSQSEPETEQADTPVAIDPVPAAPVASVPAGDSAQPEPLAATPAQAAPSPAEQTLSSPAAQASPAPVRAAPAPAPRPRPPAAPVAPLDAGSLMRQALWHSIRNFFARLFGRGQPR